VRQRVVAQPKHERGEGEEQERRGARRDAEKDARDGLDAAFLGACGFVLLL
jgi:hypothetical protein